MAETEENKFLNLVTQNEGIIHKVVGLYADAQEDKKDLTQEILLQAWRGMQNFRADSKFSTWLYKVALNTALNYRKQSSKRMESPLLSEERLPVVNDVKTDTELLYLVIRQLDEVDRMLISLHLDGYKNLEIAEISGMTTNHINVKLFRIKKQIGEKFKAIYNEA